MEYQPSDARYQSMKYNRVGRSGVRLPAVSLGFWHNFGDVDVFQNGRNIARRAFDNGLSYYPLLLERIAALPGVRSVGYARAFGNVVSDDVGRVPIGFVGTPPGDLTAQLDVERLLFRRLFLFLVRIRRARHACVRVDA